MQNSITRCDSVNEFDDENDVIWNLSENEILKIQQHRSDQRKLRYQKLPILLSILKELPQQSLLNLSNEYEKYKTKTKNEEEQEIHLDEIMNSVIFQQDKNKINPYQSQCHSSIYQQPIQESPSITQLLQNSLMNLKDDLSNILQQNSELKEQISQFFYQIQTSQSNRNNHLNVLNYDLKIRQDHYQDIQLCILPMLEKERLDLQTKCKQQKKIMEEQYKNLHNYRDIENEYSQQQEYIQQLKMGGQQMSQQISKIRERIEELKQAQQIMSLEMKLEKFCTILLEKQYENRQNVLLDFQQQIDICKFRIMKNFKGHQNQSIMELDDISIVEELKSEIDLLSMNQSQVKGYQKIKQFQQQIKDKISVIKTKQKHLEIENAQLIQEIELHNPIIYQQQIVELQQKHKLYQDEYSQFEKEIQQLELTVQAGSEMVQDLEQQQEILKQQRNSEKQSPSIKQFFRKLKANRY